VKAQVSIAHVIGEYVMLRPVSNRLIGRCPFHDDRDPSFVVYPPTRSFYCFGCGKHGDVVNFVMAIADITLREALDRIEDGTLHHEGDAASA
jgi:DNA primase